jgi:hypothetical protein
VGVSVTVGVGVSVGAGVLVAVLVSDGFVVGVFVEGLLFCGAGVGEEASVGGEKGTMGGESVAVVGIGVSSTGKLVGFGESSFLTAGSIVGVL